MKFYIQLLLISVSLLILAGCNSAPADSIQIDLASLPEVIDVQTLVDIKDMDDVFLLDVREAWEYEEGHIPGVTLIPMGDIPSNLSQIPTDKRIIVTCRSGNRSSTVTKYLQEKGYENVHNLQGGFIAWNNAGLPVDY